MKNIIHLFDRSFAKSYKRQIIWLAGITFVMLGILLAIGKIPGLYDGSLDDSSRGMFYDVLFLMIDPGNSSSMSSGFALLVDIIGVVVFSGLFISVLTNMLERRVELYEQGRLHYRMKNQIVVIGYNDTVPALIHHLCRQYPNKDQFILLQVSHDIDSVRSELETKLNSAEANRLVIYSGEPTIEEDLRNLLLEDATCLYVMANSSLADMCVMDVVKKVAHGLDQRKTKLPCYAQFKDQEIFRLLQYAELDTQINKALNFYPFNCENIWAQQVLVYNQAGDGAQLYEPIDGRKGIDACSPKHVHLILIGLNSMSEAMAVQAAHIAHFPNFKEGEVESKTKISFIGNGVSEWKDHLTNSFPDLFAGKCDSFLDIQWQFVEGMIQDVSVKSFINSTIKDENALVTIVIAHDNSEYSLYDATHLPYLTYTADNVLQILVRQEESASMVELVQSAPASKFNKLRAFGQKDDFFQNNLVPEHFGKMVNARYSGITDMGERSAIEKRWESLSTANKWSSMHSANMRFVRMRSLGFDLSTQSPQQLKDLIDLHIGEMMKVEHCRWNMEKLLSGFRPLTDSEKKQATADKAEKKRLQNPPYYAHLDICSYEELCRIDADTIQYDADVIKALPDMIAQSTNR